MNYTANNFKEWCQEEEEKAIWLYAIIIGGDFFYILYDQRT